MHQIPATNLETVTSESCTNPANTLQTPARQRRTQQSFTSLQQAISLLLQQTADDLNQAWGGGAISSSAYETAWVAMVRSPHDASQLAFPQTLEWILDHQHDTGLWGPATPYALVPSLAAFLALLRVPQPTERIRYAIARAEHALQHEIINWSPDDADTPFVEFLVPQLVQLIAIEGVDLSLKNRETMEQRAAEKITYFPAQTIYNGNSNLIHAIEALTDIVDCDKMVQCQATNGSFGYSPSATAAILMHASRWNTAAERWLQHLLNRRSDDHGGMPTSHPSDIFEVSWVSYLLMKGGYAILTEQPQIAHTFRNWLEQSLTEHGTSFASIRAMPEDVDDTSMTIAMLCALGNPVSPEALWNFETEEHFVSYAHERTSSTSANAHVLEALLETPDNTQLHRIAKVVQYLLQQQSSEGYWYDKWHISRYYATFSVIAPFARLHASPSLRNGIHSNTGNEITPIGVYQSMQQAARWILSTQQSDGGWGDNGSTAEETAYAVLSLTTLSQQLSTLILTGHIRALQRGRRFIWRHFHDAEHPPLWVDKSLYTPNRVVQAAIYAALHSTIQGRVLHRKSNQ